MKFLSFTAAADDSGRRIDRVIRKWLAQNSLSTLYAYIRKGLIKVNNKKVSAQYRVQEGDIITVPDFSVSIIQHSNCASKTTRQIILTDLFCNEYIRIINKPYGISVQGGQDINIADIVAEDYQSRHSENTSLSFKPGPLHRLDRQTTGILVFSQNLIGAQWFSRALTEHRIHKEYIAITQGHMTHTHIWRDSIAVPHSHTKTRQFHRVCLANKQPDTDTNRTLSAETHACPLATGFLYAQPITIVKFIIPTGRKHQIRIHSSSHGFPLIGDTAYGGIKIKGVQQLFLHAWRLSLPANNSIGLPEMIQAPLPSAFKEVIKKSLLEKNDIFILNTELDDVL